MKFDVYSKLYYTIIVASVLGGSSIFFNAWSGYLSLASIVIMFFGVYLAVKVLFGNRAMVPIGGLIGAFIIVAAVMADVLSTLYFSPDLSREANPIARNLIDFGFSVRETIIIGIFSQIGILIISICIWLNFSLNKERYIDGVFENNGHIPLFMKMYGVKGDGYLHAIIGGKIDAFVFTLGIAVPMLGVYIYRIYLALEWNNVVPVSRLYAPSIIFMGSFFLHYIWVRNRIKILHQPG